MKSKNLTFSDLDPKFKNYWKNENRKHHGGEYSRGKRKTRRPLSIKKPLHLVLRSDVASGAMSLRIPKNRAAVTKLIRKYSLHFNIRIYQFSVNSNHLHIVLKSKSRKSFQDFLRALAGMIARFVMGSEKGAAKGKFWSCLAFTRVSEWGRAYKNLKAYVIQNILEAAGVIAYTPRTVRAGNVKNPYKT